MILQISNLIFYLAKTFYLLKCALKMYIENYCIESTLDGKLFKIAVEGKKMRKVLKFCPHFRRKKYNQVQGQKSLFSNTLYKYPFSPILVLSVSLRYLCLRHVLFVSL